MLNFCLLFMLIIKVITEEVKSGLPSHSDCDSQESFPSMEPNRGLIACAVIYFREECFYEGVHWPKYIIADSQNTTDVSNVKMDWDLSFSLDSLKKWKEYGERPFKYTNWEKRIAGATVRKDCTLTLYDGKYFGDPHILLGWGHHILKFYEWKDRALSFKCKCDFHKATTLYQKTIEPVIRELEITEPITSKPNHSQNNKTKLDFSENVEHKPTVNDPYSSIESTIAFIIIFVITILLLLLISLFFIIKYYKKKRYDREAANNDDETLCLIDEKRLTKLRTIGSGFSATVYLMQYEPKGKKTESEQVAVKKIQHASFKLEDSIREMNLIKECVHQNIVKFRGYFREGNQGPINIVTEYMPGGDLYRFVKDANNRPTMGDCFQFILQIVEGMDYLSQKQIVHRDLAARNCLLDRTHKIVKISDFGLSRWCNYDYEYYSKNINNDVTLPFRWAAIEVQQSPHKFSNKSDVWSFGIVMWEIFSRGTLPYEKLNLNEIKLFLLNGGRMERPNYCPKSLYRIMIACWNQNPAKRPKFRFLKIRINQNLEALMNNDPSQLSVSYEKATTNNRFKGSQKERSYINFVVPKYENETSAMIQEDTTESDYDSNIPNDDNFSNDNSD